MFLPIEKTFFFSDFIHILNYGTELFTVQNPDFKNRMFFFVCVVFCVFVCLLDSDYKHLSLLVSFKFEETILPLKVNNTIRKVFDFCTFSNKLIVFLKNFDFNHILIILSTIGQFNCKFTFTTYYTQKIAVLYFE